jgi:hypothetical protein
MDRVISDLFVYYKQILDTQKNRKEYGFRSLIFSNVAVRLQLTA